MNYLRCKCGKAEYWESGMPPQPCQGCDECGTTYAYSPNGHKGLVAHDWRPQYDRNTGGKTKRICRRCYAREPAKAIEAGTAKTERLGPTDESAVGKADLPSNGL